MRIVSAILYGLDIPFVESFRHNLAERSRSGSVVLKVTSDTGVSGYGEGVPRPYVTGETQATSLEHIRSVLAPAFLGVELGGIDVRHPLAALHALLPCADDAGGVVWHAARCAVELALMDCLLRAGGTSLADVLPPRVPEVVYSGVMSAGSAAHAEKTALRFKAMGFRQVKLKVEKADDAEQVGLVRSIMGPAVSLRLDANGAFSLASAVSFLSAVEPFHVACIEQPLPRGNPSELALLRTRTAVPVMADESVITLRDADALIALKACDLFNLRVSKCGGLHLTLEMARRAASAGIGIQLGCQVGETAILSAAGRHLAAHLSGLCFVEGSYGTHILTEDVAEESMVFGRGGAAPVLKGAGLGVSVRDDILSAHASVLITCR